MYKLEKRGNKQKKMSRQKEYYLIIDTETCNTLEQPLPYDIGYVISDRKGNIYETRSFVVAETFFDMKETMQSAYFAEKIPQYLEDIKNGTREVRTVWTIRKQIHEDMKKYNIKKVFAYNMGFDKRALNNLMRYVTKSFCRWFFPFGTEFCCIWSIACQVLLNTTSYIKFAIKNGFESNCGNVLTNAECCHRFITNSIDFNESHTALEDVMIEVEILAECIAKKKAIDKSINPNCWRIPQKKRKELELKATSQKVA